MVISFSHDTAFEYFQKNGFVFTFRTSRRKRPNTSTWMNRGRGEKKVADVHVREIGRVDPTDVDNLKPMFRSSGFVTPQLWQRAIEEVNGSLPNEGWVYLVLDATKNEIQYDNE